MKAEVAAGVADGGRVRGDDEGEAATDGGGVEVGDGERKEGGEARRKRGSRLPESDRRRVKCSAGGGVGNGGVAGETDGVVVQVGISD